MPVPRYTHDELRSALERSEIPSLITEGRNDYAVMRHLAQNVGGDCLPAGNKDGVLRISDDPIVGTRPRTAFLVDADLWAVRGAPPERLAHPRLVITDGYSIENDLLRDANVEGLLDGDELGPYAEDIRHACSWFAAGVVAREGGVGFDFNVGVNSILLPDAGGLTAAAQLTVDTYTPPEDLIDEIAANHQRLLRGKTWLSVLNRYFCATGRLVQHPPLSLLAIGMRSGGLQSTRLKEELAALL
jgi:hypothetical protein